MALYRATIYKRLDALDQPKWVNTYYINDTVLANAFTHAEDVAEMEAAVTAEAVLFYRISLKEMPDGPTALKSISLTGGVTIDPVNLVPMFNTVRVILGDEFERVESKYLRCVIAEANVQGFNISGELRDFVQTNYCEPLLGLLNLRGPNNELITSATCQQLIQMRQLSWHRRSRPGFKRGWVPV